MRLPVILGLTFLLIFTLLRSVFVVEQYQMAMVLMFGELKRVEESPGLKLKIPFFEDVVYYDKRILNYSAESAEVILGDQKRLIVDSFVKYRITNPLLFFQRVNNEVRWQQRLKTILDHSLREVLGTVPVTSLLKDDRSTVMELIQKAVEEQVLNYGVKIVDVRIMRADFPTANSQRIYERMQSGREKEAREIRAKGAEASQRIKSESDKEQRIIIADAQRDAEIIRGKGDADALKILIAATSVDTEFYSFYRSLEAYRKSLTGDTTRLILSPDSEFLRYFKQID